MSILVANEGKQVTIIIPKRIAVGCEVKVKKCSKVTVDDVTVIGVWQNIPVLFSWILQSFLLRISLVGL